MSGTEEFTIRGMREDEAESFFDHVAKVFGKKGTPREYFVRHYVNDKTGRPEDIRLAVNKAGVIVSTLKVYRRRIHTLCGDVDVGGIGEVATSDEYQGKGLASALLSDAKAYMLQQNMPLSLLFTGNAAKLYAKHGWIDTTARFSVITYQADAPHPESNITIRAGQETDLARCIVIHGIENAARVGWAVRSEVYWRSWILAEATHWRVMVDSEGQIEAYMILSVGNSPKAERQIVVKDFATATTDGQARSKQFKAFLAASHTWMQETMGSGKAHWPVLYPTIVLPEDASTTLDARSGYMFNPLAPPPSPAGQPTVSTAEFDPSAALVAYGLAGDNYIYWHIDKF